MAVSKLNCDATAQISPRKFVLGTHIARRRILQCLVGQGSWKTSREIEALAWVGS